MNCREAQNQIFAERDGALAETERAALVLHVTQCGGCRQLRENLALVLTHWQTKAQTVAVPDATIEWHAVRRKIRGGAEAGEVRATSGRPSLLTWLSVPLAAAGALAMALFISLPGSKPEPAAIPAAPHLARAESVEVSGHGASTSVYVDDKSGWLIVWASDAKPKRG